MTYITNKEYRILRAEKEAFATYGDVISVDVKNKSLIKFGTNVSLQQNVEQTVWITGGVETYQTTNAIDSIVSTDPGDTQQITLEGHTISGNILTFVSQNVTLSGTTTVTLPTPLARANRLFNIDTTNFAGIITVFVSGEGGTTHLTTQSGKNQTLKGATSVSNSDYWILTGWSSAIKRNTAASVDFELQIRELPGVFRTRKFRTTSSNGGTDFVPFDPCIIVRKNSDVRIQATSNANSTQAETTIFGYLASVIT